MTLEQLSHGEDAIVRRYDYDDGAVLAVDFGAANVEATADVVDETLLVVVGEEQYEFDLPAAAAVDRADAHTFIRNGVLSIDLEADQ